MITKQDFERVYKNYTYKWDGYRWINPNLVFNGEEIVKFLEKNGYSVITHTAIGKTVSRTYNAGGGTDSEEYGHDYVERIIALKKGETPPEKWEDNDSNSGYGFPSIIETFTNLLREKLLNL